MFEYFCKEHDVNVMSFGVEVLKTCEKCVERGEGGELMDHIEWEG